MDCASEGVRRSRLSLVYLREVAFMSHLGHDTSLCNQHRFPEAQLMSTNGGDSVMLEPDLSPTSFNNGTSTTSASQPLHDRRVNRSRSRKGASCTNRPPPPSPIFATTLRPKHRACGCHRSRTLCRLPAFSPLPEVCKLDGGHTHKKRMEGQLSREALVRWTNDTPSRRLLWKRRSGDGS